MSFVKANLGLIGPGASGDIPNHWSYKTDDVATAVDNVNYFNNASDLLKVGDFIHIVIVTNLGASNEALADAVTVIVNSNSSGVVDVTDVTDWTTTDAGG